MIASIIAWLTGGGINLLVSRWTALESERLRAKNDEDRLQLEWQQSRIEAQLRMAEIATRDRWSATSIGRYLIVIPFGVWYSLIIADSIFAFEWNVLALPPAIMDLSMWLFPAIIVGDLGKSVLSRRK